GRHDGERGDRRARRTPGAPARGAAAERHRHGRLRRCSPDECIPAEANRVAERVGINAPSFDLSAACSSFGAQLHFLTGMRPERLPEFVLVVNPENSTRVVDYRDRSSCVLWGDGTSATILSPRTPGRYRITETLLGGDP